MPALDTMHGWWIKLYFFLVFFAGQNYPVYLPLGFFDNFLQPKLFFLYTVISVFQKWTVDNLNITGQAIRQLN